MKNIMRAIRLIAASSILALAFLANGVAFATPDNYNDPNFKLVWERTDKPVEDGVTARSWMWGPETVPGSLGSEPYAESPGGNRTVQYFDKSRMEVNDPNADRTQLWFVTNGLLVREMVLGQIQIGNASFTNHGSSTEAVAGDPAADNPNCPNYATFKNIASLNGDHPSTAKSGTVNEFINKAGNVATGTSPDASVAYAYFEGTLKHNIPNVLWNFMNQTGPIYWDGTMHSGTVIDWTFAMGLPITDPYWTKARVGGVERDILVQLFERRVLTYTPSNPDGFKVEMGNVGQHYKRWRYDTPAQEVRIVFVSMRAGGAEIWSMRTDGTDPKRLTNSAGANMWPSWSPDNSKIVFQSDRDGNWEIYVMNADGSGQQRLTFDGAADIYPTWNADGSRIAWSKAGNVFTMAPNGGDVQQLSNTASMETNIVYSPDGNSIAWGSNFPAADFEIYRGNLDGSGITRLTNRPAFNDYPTDWKGDKILFVSGNAAVKGIGSMNSDGSGIVPLAGTTEIVGFARGGYSPDGGKITWGAGTDIWIVNTDGTNPVKLTNHPAYDGQPDWSN